MDGQSRRIIIIGGGFAGVFTAKYLSKCAVKDLEIELISEKNYFVFQPLLPEVASGTINAQDAVTPLRILLHGLKIRLAEVLEIDFEQKLVRLVQGRKRTLISLAYDHLVIASGQVVDLSRFSGFTEHSLRMKDLSDAYILRNHIISCLETADVTENEDLKRRLLCFVVGGGGFSGVETIGEITEMIQRSLKYYPNINRSEIQYVLIQRGDRILPELTTKLALYAHKKLTEHGIAIYCNVGVISAMDTAVMLDNGQRIETSTFITTVGNGPSRFVQSLPLELQWGKIPTDRYLRVQGLNEVWAVGDIALIPNPRTDQQGEQTFASSTAQFAVREAKNLAANIVATIQGRKLTPFYYKNKGSFASIGNYTAVAEVCGLRISGVLAWILWRGFYLAMLPSFVTKLRVVLNWMLDYFVPRTIVQIQQAVVPAVKYVHYAEGDQVFEKDRLIDGFYVVISGSLEMRVPSTDNGKEFVKRIGPGEHWGEMIISEDCLTTGAVTALEDSVVLVFRKNDFARFRKSFKPLDNYFDNIPDSHYSRRMPTTASSHKSSSSHDS